jgi:hypothetical protein
MLNRTSAKSSGQFPQVMKNPPPGASATAVFNEDDRLMQLELRVAQRADKLSQESGNVRGRDLEHWLQAEQDIFERCRARGKAGLTVAEG